MNIILETKQLLIREIHTSDRLDMFEMDSDPLVHQYIFNNPVKEITEIDEAIRHIQNQYRTNGTGRLAVILTQSGEMVGL